MAKTAPKRLRDRQKPATKAAAPARMKLAKGASPGTKKALAKRDRKPKAVKGRTRAADQPLPGMNDFDRDPVLSKCASKVADERFTRSESDLREVDWMVMAEKRMKDKGLFTYSAHGVDFLRTEGKDKFTAKWKKEDGNKARKQKASETKTATESAADHEHDVQGSDGGPLPGDVGEDDMSFDDANVDEVQH